MGPQQLLVVVLRLQLLRIRADLFGSHIPLCQFKNCRHNCDPHEHGTRLTDGSVSGWKQ